MTTVEDAAIAAATSQMRMALMATGGVTLDQVDRYAEPLARAVVGAAAPILVADAEKRGAVKALRLLADRGNEASIAGLVDGAAVASYAKLYARRIESGEVTL